MENEPCDEGAGIGLAPPPGSRAHRVLPSSLQQTLFLPLFSPNSSEFGVIYAQGQSVLTGKGTTVDLQGLSNGVYHITITTNSESKTLRFIKSNP